MPTLPDQGGDGAPVPATVRFEPLTTDELQVVVEAIRPVESIEYYSEAPGVLPIGVAELGIPGVQRPTPSTALETTCREDLLELDGDPIGLRVSGSIEDAAARSALVVEPCGDAADGIDVGAGDHVLRAAKGAETGLDIDRLVLRSEVSGQEGGAPGGSGAAATGAPELETVGSGRTSHDLRVRGASEPFWLVLGQSHSLGWTAKVDGQGGLGEPVLVDGFANGWYVDPGDEQDVAITLEWVPQRRVRTALVVSAGFLLLCLGIVAWGWRRRDARAEPVPAPEGHGPARAGLASPLSWRRGRLSRRQAVLLTLVGAAGAAAVVSPLAGAIVGVVVASAVVLHLRGRWGRPLLTGGAVVAYASSVGLIIAEVLFRDGLIADFEWPTYFPQSHLLAWLALALLAVDVVIGSVLSRQDAPGDGPASA